ncbi:hypothetical protein [Streptomyces silvensis]|uniref:Uncharacterized protein n=1 Tax=Streptomyces silvensis TaxID=1765722 RepID=A0A0W7X8P3_9ACTN|nr:hypothetical protein [Streptomyces silvensis]KUF19131.1 hypothetical protein AT728_21410 [Streptomyces silvensis]
MSTDETITVIADDVEYQAAADLTPPEGDRAWNATLTARDDATAYAIFLAGEGTLRLGDGREGGFWTLVHLIDTDGEEETYQVRIEGKQGAPFDN